MEDNKILYIAANALNEKKAMNIEAIKVADLTVITDYFLIATATSSTHVRSLADEVEEKLAKEEIMPRQIEGKATGWILLDYGRVIIHIFTPQMREFYNLEHLWSDGEKVDIDKILENVREEN
ncbi:MAG: ribosome silencing factor [Clostridia bacterium]|nr:ribosome silencing factor [Clostridia bacterium]